MKWHNPFQPRETELTRQKIAELDDLIRLLGTYVAHHKQGQWTFMLPVDWRDFDGRLYIDNRGAAQDGGAVTVRFRTEERHG